MNAPNNVAAAQAGSTSHRPEDSNGTPLAPALAAASDAHDFQDAGNPLEKMHPDPNHWSRWAEREERCLF